MDTRGTAKVLYVEGKKLWEVIRLPPHRARDEVSRHQSAEEYAEEHAWVGRADKVP